jgi:hypothetical protein
MVWSPSMSERTGHHGHPHSTSTSTPPLTVVAGNLYRLFARNLPRYQHATPDTLWRHFLDDTGTLHITPDGVTANLTLRSHHPVLIDTGFADLQLPILWDTEIRIRALSRASYYPPMLFLLSLMIRAVARLLVLPRTEGATKDLEILVLRHQLRVLRRKTSRPRFTTLDRVLLATASRLLPQGSVGIVAGDTADAAALAPHARAT